MTNNLKWVGSGGSRSVKQAAHRHWLKSQAVSLLGFYQDAAVNPAGGFFSLDGTGRPVPPNTGATSALRYLHDTSRMVHCYAIGDLLGLLGCERNIDHGMDFLWARHRDTKNGGYFYSVDDDGPVDANKQAYAHAFVLLAAASAKIVGHPDADRLLDDIGTVLKKWFWDINAGASREEFSPDWMHTSEYRGQNSNMHLTEATMAAFEVTGDRQYLEMAERIADLIINRHARQMGWRVAEHFDSNWQVDREYRGDPMFRPHGTTPGHALEWSRLLIHLWALGDHKHDWMKQAARQLLEHATRAGWDNNSGGFFYTLDWDGQPDQAAKYWWPCAEGIGATTALASVFDDDVFEHWYRQIWDYIDCTFIDHENGGWWPDANAGVKIDGGVFVGRPDLYHALQACLIPLMPSDRSVTAGLANLETGRSGISLPL